MALCRLLKELGVERVDVSSAGTVPDAKIPVGPNYQAPFAHRIRQETQLPVAAVGLITQPAQALGEPAAASTHSGRPEAVQAQCCAM